MKFDPVGRIHEEYNVWNIGNIQTMLASYYNWLKILKFDQLNRFIAKS